MLEGAVLDQPGPYVLGGTQTEQQRLLAQASDFETQSTWLLDRIGVQQGWRAVDIGCGPIGILDLLSARVGKEGSVVGLEREKRFVDAARAEVASRGLRNVEIVQADALNTGLREASFDLVHERLVMINVPAREVLLQQMISLLRPGGIILLEDVDDISYTCVPPHPSWTVLLDAFHTAFHANGGNAYIGRELSGYLRDAGIKNVQVKVHAGTVNPREYRRTHLLSLLDVMHDKVVGSGILSESQLSDHREDLITHLNNPDTLLIDKLLVQAWGQK
jgi:ubiquinone/menaquinone biosynthesis C-methylase UbiE